MERDTAPAARPMQPAALPKKPDARTQAALDEAQRLFAAGYNCAQSVVGALWRYTGLTRQQALAVSAGLGAGVGRLRETCGAASGLAMVLGGALRPGSALPEGKWDVYEQVQQCLLELERYNGSLVCRRLLGLPEGHRDIPRPAPGTPPAAHHAVCIGYICNAVQLTCRWLAAREAAPAPQTLALDAAWYAANRPQRPANGHKGTFGRVLAVCGSARFRGAAALCCEGALRAGAGLVQLAAPECVCAAVAARLPEATLLPLPPQPPQAAALVGEALQAADAAVIGCGLGREEPAAALTAALLCPQRRPTVVDADALALLAGLPCPLAAQAEAPARILTPHVGEMARLLGMDAAAVERDLPAAARTAAAQTGSVVVLKSSRTAVASPAGRCLLLDMPNSGLATGGSGDVLAGLCAGLLAQGLPAFEAAGCAVWLHASAAKRAAAARSEASMLPSDLLAQL